MLRPMHPLWKIIITGALGICTLGVVGYFLLIRLAPPSDAKAIALAQATMREFAEAVRQRDFADLYNNSSEFWQTQTTPKAIATAFEGFFPFSDQVSEAVTVHDPLLTAEPFIESEKALIVEGYYPIEESRLVFHLQYIRDNLTWKLFGMDIVVQ